MFAEEWRQEKIDRHLIAAQVRPFGISYLDDALVGIFPNDLILIGAKTGVGKTELATQIALNAAQLVRNVTFFALEADQWEIQRRIKYRALSQVFFKYYAASTNYRWPRYSEWMAKGLDAELDSWEQTIEQELNIKTSTLRVIYQNKSFTVKDFTDQIEEVAEETDLIILDHLHYFDFEEETEIAGLKRAIREIRRCALVLRKPVIVIAHLRKDDRNSKLFLPSIEDFHGHSDIVKIATNVLLLAPGEDLSHDGIRYPTYFYIAKSRRAAEVKPYVGLLGYDIKSNSYNDKYFLQKFSKFEAPKEITDRKLIPSWAKHAKISMPKTRIPMKELKGDVQDAD